MAEIVQRNLELSLADLEPMETSGLCSKQEAIQIIQKRRHYEYKLLRKPPRKADYLSYIQYEVYLYMLFCKRKNLHTDRSRSTPYGKLLYSANRIHILFTRMLRRFKADLRIWLQYADFCKRVRHYNRLSKCITKAVRIHPRCSGLWSLGAWTALTFDSDSHAARVLLLSGLRVLPSDQHLWLELSRLEILHTYKIKKRQTMLKLDFLDSNVDLAQTSEAPYKAAIVVYTQATEHMPNDPELKYKFIQLFRDYKNTEELQDLAFQGLKEDSANNHKAWLYLTKKPVLRYMDTHGVEWNVALHACESQVEQIFEDAIQLNPTSKDIWEEYIMNKIECISVGEIHARANSVQSLLQLIKRSHDAAICSENIHILYVNFLREEGLLQEVNTFISELGDQVMEMPMLLQTVGRELNEETKENIFSLLIKSTKNLLSFDLYPISTWNIILDQYCTPALAVDKVNSLVDGIYNISLRSQHPGIGEVLLKLIRWSSENEPLQLFRAKYKKILIHNNRKWPMELYLFCSRIEESQEPINEANIDLIFEKIINSHGGTSVEVWLEYARVKRVIKNFPGAGDCYWRAMKTLNPSLVEGFINKYTLSSLL